MGRGRSDHKHQAVTVYAPQAGAVLVASMGCEQMLRRFGAIASLWQSRGNESAPLITVS